jgi:hypothetical protein
MYIEGINPLDSYVAALESPLPFPAGTRGLSGDGREWVFQTITSAVTAGDVMQLGITPSAVAVPLTTAAAIYNRQVGVAGATFAAAAGGTGFWCCVRGAIAVKTSAAVAANALCYTTATSSAIDDTAAASNLVRGLTLTTAAGSATTSLGLLNYPLIGTVADTDNQT